METLLQLRLHRIGWFIFYLLGVKNRFKKLQDNNMTVWKLDSLRKWEKNPKPLVLSSFSILLKSPLHPSTCSERFVWARRSIFTGS